MQILKLADKDFKAAIIAMLKNIKEISAEKWNYKKESIGNFKTKKYDIWEKNSLDGPNNRLAGEGGSINDLEGRAI